MKSKKRKQRYACQPITQYFKYFINLNLRLHEFPDVHFVTCLYVTEDERLKLNCDQGLLIDNVHTSFCRG